MHWRKRRLRHCYLYVIVKADLARARRIALSGVDIIQLRDKSASDKKLLDTAQKLALFCKKKKILFIINDRLEIALLSGADGVHLGQDDLPIKEARKIVRRDFLIGISTHSRKQALQAQDEGADYVAFGPIFTTRTKPGLKAIGPEGISFLKKKLKIPYFVIGNVGLKNLSLLKNKGAKAIAVHSAVYSLKDPRGKISSFKKQLS